MGKSVFFRPQKRMVYRPWIRGDEHTWKQAPAKIHQGNIVLDGTFSIREDGSCVIHLWHRGKRPAELTLPRRSVKTTKRTDAVAGAQPTLWGKTITYDVTIRVTS